MSYFGKPLAMAGISDIATTAASVVSDPAWPEVSCRVSQLRAIEAKKPVPVCAKMNVGAGGIGLRKALPPLRAYVYAEQHPLVKPATVAAILGIPFLLGFLAGTRS